MGRVCGSWADKKNMASSSSCRKKKSVASITEPTEIIDEFDYF